jgi:hypothetical protein
MQAKMVLAGAKVTEENKLSAISFAGVAES